MDKPIFINTDPQMVVNGIKTDYETLTGRTLQDGQVETLLINAFAYRETLLRSEIQNASLQNLVAFSTAPYLDFLGDLVGVKRLLSSSAVVPIKLSFTNGHGNMTIPKGIRVQSVDGLCVFTLDNDVSILVTDTFKVVNFTATQNGILANGYEAGKIAIILDPQPYLLNAENTEISAGGSNDEVDEELRKRIMLAPQSFSNAGSKGAYTFFAMSANSGISDVAITSPIPGQVNIYPLMKGGNLPNSTVLNEVYNTCNADKIRPLTDTVIVQSPTVVPYSIVVQLTVLTGAVDSDAIATVKKNLEKYTETRKNKLGRDVVLDRITAESMKAPQVYDVQIIEPQNTLVVAPNEVAKCSNVIVNVTGYSDE